MPLRDSIKRKIIAAIMQTSVAVLLVTVFGFLVCDLVEFRKMMVRNLETEAQMVAGNSTAALAFKNNTDGIEILSSLQADPHVISAALYDTDGNLFVQYPSELPATNFPPRPMTDGSRFSRSQLVIFEPVVQSGNRLGTLYIASDLYAITRRLQVYGSISLGITVVSLLLAFWISSRFQKQLSRPILTLSNTAHWISERRDYSARAPKTSDDELGYLTDAFNSMLEQIQNSHSELNRSRERVQVIADHASVFICQIDRNYRYTFVNRTFAERFQTTVDNIIGKQVSEVTGEAAFQNFLPYMERAFKGERVEFEKEINYHTFGPRWIHAIYSPERAAAGQVNAIVAVISDISDRKQAELELERARDEAMAASRAKDEFLAALSHELRTPLNPVLLMASDGASNPDFSPEVRRVFDSIDKNVSLEARLIDDLLDLTRIARNKLKLNRVKMDAHQVLQNALEIVNGELFQKEISFSARLEATHTIVFADPVRLQQVFWNVLKNAIKFTPAKGTVSLCTANLDGRLITTVSDSGIGLTADELPYIFNAFAQGEYVSATHRFGGLGLGLAISQRLIELQSGKIHAASEGRGRGATFTIELPLLPPAEKAGFVNVTRSF
ncbi:MAG TPA: ATP-binding protein [Verrucomicrobiae bacterium]|nr:ATP-binding protein [Verrucomicrobiae bacterium]